MVNQDDSDSGSTSNRPVERKKNSDVSNVSPSPTTFKPNELKKKQAKTNLPPPPPAKKQQRKNLPPPPPPAKKQQRKILPAPPPPRKRTNKGIEVFRHKRGEFNREVAKSQGSRRMLTWYPTGEESGWFEPEGPVRVQTMKLLNEKLGTKYRRLIPEATWDLWQLQTILEWYQENIAYFSDPDNQDYWQEPHQTLEGGGGDCDDHALLFASMVLSIGGRARIVVSYIDSKNGHAFCEVSIGVNPSSSHKADQLNPNALEHWDAYVKKMAIERPYRVGYYGNRPPNQAPVHYDVEDLRWVTVDPMGSAWIGDIDALQKMGYVLDDGTFRYASYKTSPFYITPKNITSQVRT